MGLDPEQSLVGGLVALQRLVACVLLRLMLQSVSRRPLRIALVLGGLLAVVASCWPSGGSSETAGSASPLEDLIGFRFDSLEEADETLFARTTELVQECMIGRGFEYQPSGATLSAYPEDAGPGTEQWESRYGFGVTTTFFPEPLLPDGLIGRPVSKQAFETAQSEYVAGLGPDERAAYEVALNGSGDVPRPGSSQDEIEIYSETSDGCFPASQRAAREEFPPMVFFDAFGPQIQDLITLVEGDPEMLEYERELRRCIIDFGLDWTTYPQVVGELRRQISQISLTPGPPPDNAPQASPSLTLDQHAVQVLGTLQADELELAAAFRRCENEVGERDVVVRRISASYESDFIAENRTGLDDLGF